MNKKLTQTGAILITTIMMVVLLSILVISLMQGVWLYFKTSNRITTHHQAFYALEAAACSLSLNHDLLMNNCKVREKNPNQPIQLVREKHGCTYVFNHHSYTYLWEDLGPYPSLQLAANDNKESKHIRLTMIAPTSEILQLRITTDPFVEQDKQPVKLHKTLIISWRYLATEPRVSKRSLIVN